MSILEHTPSHVQPLADLLPRLAAARSLVADIEAEVRALGRHAPLIPLCGHADRPLAGVLVNGQPACNGCAAKSIGIPPRDAAYLQSLEAGEVSDEWQMPRFTPMTGDLR